jgi:hypothetical protein
MSPILSFPARSRFLWATRGKAVSGRAGAVQTVYSITFPHPDGGSTVIDYLDQGGWWQHDFNAEGVYLEAIPTDARVLTPLFGDGSPSLVYELRKCAEAMGRASARLHGSEGKALRRDRRDVLVRLDRAVAESWDDAMQRLESTPPDDEIEIARATRAIEFMRSARELARSELSP